MTEIECHLQSFNAITTQAKAVSFIRRSKAYAVVNARRAELIHHKYFRTRPLDRAEEEELARLQRAVRGVVNLAYPAPGMKHIEAEVYAALKRVKEEDAV